jgi:hypothetical protein
MTLGMVAQQVITEHSRAVAASTIGTSRGNAQGLCRPLATRMVSSLAWLTMRGGLQKVAVGLNATSHHNVFAVRLNTTQAIGHSADSAFVKFIVMFCAGAQRARKPRADFKPLGGGVSRTMTCIP